MFLSDDESQAWRAAHRMGGEPRVLYVDTVRQRRRRLKLQRNRRGLYARCRSSSGPESMRTPAEMGGCQPLPSMAEIADLTESSVASTCGSLRPNDESP